VRLVLIGPTHPYKGGIAQHTTALAHRLGAAGHEVDVWSWRRQYPARLYPGEQRVPGSVPELPVPPRVSEPLSWDRPVGWITTGRRARGFDGVVLTWTTPVQGPPYLGLLAGLHRHAAVVTLCHNVLPHEPSRMDRPLARAVFRRSSGLLVHSTAQQAAAQALVPATPTAVAALPPPGLTAGARTSRTGTLLFFGLVRPYKGLDVLLEALPGTSWRLVVAGEFWGDALAEAQAQVARLGLDDRVDLRPGYVAAADVGALFAEADALVLPYRSATGSIVADLGRDHGLPVVVTDVGTLPDGVRDGVDGLVVPAADSAALRAALIGLADGYEGFAAAVTPVDADARWRTYVEALEGLFP
jgi:glycosyltransferase involved in cell wall biosynthesis